MSVTMLAMSTAIDDHQDDAHHQRRVALRGGADGEQAHARPREDLLGDDRARDELGQQEADDGDDRDQGVPEAVADEDDAARAGPSRAPSSRTRC